jgi:hypothetical protein
VRGVGCRPLEAAGLKTGATARLTTRHSNRPANRRQAKAYATHGARLQKCTFFDRTRDRKGAGSTTLQSAKSPPAADLMPLRFEVYETRHVPAALNFNERMISGGVDPRLLLSRQPFEFNPLLPLSTESRVVVDGDRIRGGYLLQWRDFWIDGESRRLCAYQTPISEGIIDRKYMGIGPALIRHALSVNPLLYAVGMGGLDRPLPRMLKPLGFAVTTVPFVFLVNRPGRFLRQIEHLRSSPLRRLALDTLRLSGLGWLGARAWQRLHTVRHRIRSITFEVVDALDEIADRVWAESRDRYSFVGVRNAAMLRLLFSSTDRNFRRIAVSAGGDRVGWAVVLETQMKRNKYFGDMKVGVIADCLARPEHAGAVIQAAADCLSHAGVDITVANFQHAAWLQACLRAGFFQGPSTHCLALSPNLARMARNEGMHVSRGDSDGLVNF